MQLPALSDTIVAVSSAWAPSPVGIVRLSGARAFEVVQQIGAPPPLPARAAGRSLRTPARLSPDPGLVLPARALWFFAPRSYTGQDVVELHTVGSLPLVRRLAGRLVELGARPALPGEFTARAFRAGRLSTRQVEQTFDRIASADLATLRLRSRRRRSVEEALSRAAWASAELLARVEAGIDFVDEEDVRFISAGELRCGLEDCRRAVATAVAGGPPRSGAVQVLIAGRPNAGKSTLFNALLGQRRAIVSPIIGTTRDVLSADVVLGGVSAVLHDSAGLGEALSEADRAAHDAVLAALETADIVLWAHAQQEAWTPQEMRACERVDPRRRALLLTKSDLGDVLHPVPLEFAARVSVCAPGGQGLGELQAVLATLITGCAAAEPGADEAAAAAADAALARALDLSAEHGAHSPELLAVELREALSWLTGKGQAEASEIVLGRIFASFCIGK